MYAGAAFVLIAIALQSVGKVLYGTFLIDVPAAAFVLAGIAFTALVFLAKNGWGMPAGGRRLLVSLNLWTAISFIGAFYALKHLPPAVFASIEIGTAVAVAVLMTATQARTWPAPSRIVAVVGIVAGCGVLAIAELDGKGLATDLESLIAFVVAFAGGVTATLCVAVSKKLGAEGWSSSAILAHRFYLTMAGAFAWLMIDGAGFAPVVEMSIVSTLAVAAVVLLLPLLFFQLAVRRADTLTVTICLAAQPMLSFILSLPSPAYQWQPETFAGVVIVTLFVGFDIAFQRFAALRRSIGEAGAAPAPLGTPAIRSA